MKKLSSVIAIILLWTSIDSAFSQIKIRSISIQLDSIHVRTISTTYRRFDAFMDSERYIASLHYDVDVPDTTQGTSSSFYSWWSTGDQVNYYSRGSITLTYDSTQNTISSLNFQDEYTQDGKQNIYNRSFNIKNLTLKHVSPNQYEAEILKEKIKSQDFDYTLKVRSEGAGTHTFSDSYLDTLSNTIGRVVITGYMPLEVNGGRHGNETSVIFPNPSDGSFTFDDAENQKWLKIFSVSGICQETHLLNPGLNMIHTSLHEGSYFIQVGNKVERIVIQH